MLSRPRAAMLLDVTLPGGVPLLGQLPPSSRVPRISRLNALPAALDNKLGQPFHDGGPASASNWCCEEYFEEASLWKSGVGTGVSQ